MANELDLLLNSEELKVKKEYIYQLKEPSDTNFILCK